MSLYTQITVETRTGVHVIGGDVGFQGSTQRLVYDYINTIRPELEDEAYPEVTLTSIGGLLSFAHMLSSIKGLSIDEDGDIVLPNDQDDYYLEQLMLGSTLTTPMYRRGLTGVELREKQQELIDQIYRGQVIYGELLTDIFSVKVEFS